MKDLYEINGQYSYSNGFNNYAVIALILGILPNVPGFLTTIGIINKENIWSWVSNLYHYAWFVGFAVSFFFYYLLMRKSAEVNYCSESQSQ